MIDLLLAAQIINYQACEIVVSQSHQRAVREEEHNKALKEGISVPLRKIVLNVPADSAISMGLQNMSEKEKQTVEKLHEIAFYLVLKGHPFTNF